MAGARSLAQPGGFGPPRGATDPDNPFGDNYRLQAAHDKLLRKFKRMRAYVALEEADEAAILRSGQLLMARAGAAGLLANYDDLKAADLAEQGNTVGHVEIDMDENPEAAKRLSVLSLPTTIVFDAAGRPQFRINGVPKAADLRSALQPLLA